ncbi:MAG: hypothetical protein KDJ90_01200 [Nitratireductor sp.]|nr:hypothetical protein [Nitratireductor sp.]
MTTGSFDTEGLSVALARFGLITRGGFNFDNREAVPAGPSGAPARSVLLVGHGGGTIWPHFSGWLAGQEESPANPLDTWSAAILREVAGAFGARAVFPSDKPFLPFQQWAMRAEGLRPSPLGMLIHPEFGLWHAYRGALLLDVEIQIQRDDAPVHPCECCIEKPCLSTCPVSAFSQSGFDVATCRSWLDSSTSWNDSSSSHADSIASGGASMKGADCMNAGCRARNACPIGHEYRYCDAQLRFHMASFARA